MKFFAAAVTVLLVCAGCRSDGGFERRDLSHGLSFATSRFGDRTAHDAHRIWYLASSAPGALVASVGEGARNMADTYQLYLESQTHRDR